MGKAAWLWGMREALKRWLLLRRAVVMPKCGALMNGRAVSHRIIAGKQFEIKLKSKKGERRQRPCLCQPLQICAKRRSMEQWKLLSERKEAKNQFARLQH
jgi:hypothetical protein